MPAVRPRGDSRVDPEEHTPPSVQRAKPALPVPEAPRPKFRLKSPTERVFTFDLFSDGRVEIPATVTKADVEAEQSHGARRRSLLPGFF